MATWHEDKTRPGILILACLLLGYTAVSQLEKGIGDEAVHRFQIHWFIQGHYEFFTNLTMPPAYHAMMAAAARLSGATSIQVLRAIHLVIAAVAIPVFYCLCRRCGHTDASDRTLQFVFFPLLFPFFFLLYTDIPAIILVVAMLERTIARHYWLAGLLGLAAVVMRQVDIIWVGYAAVLVLFQFERSWSPGTLLARLWPYLAVGAGFLLFILVNQGIALGDSAHHQVSLNLSNLYFCLLLAFFLFLPLNIEYGCAVARLLYRNRWLWGVVIAAFSLYLVTYAHPHRYNDPELSFYIHNLWLHYSCDMLALRLAAFVPILWMALTCYLLARNSAVPYRLYVLYGFALFSFVPIPLIEPRYYLVSLILLIAFSPGLSQRGRVATLLMYVVLSAWLLYHIAQRQFFL